MNEVFCLNNQNLQVFLNKSQLVLMANSGYYFLHGQNLETMYKILQKKRQPVSRLLSLLSSLK